MRYAGVLLSMIAAISPAVATAQGDSAEISRIRTRFVSINSDTTSYRIVRRDIEGYAVEGADISGYFMADTLKKIVARYFAESGFGREEFYFWQGQLIFVFRQKNRSSQQCLDCEGVDENRFYLSGGRLLRWVNERGLLLVADQPAAIDETRRLLRTAAEFTALLRDADPPVRPVPAVDCGAEGLRRPGEAQARMRACLAVRHEQILREKACSTCRVWVSGIENRSIFILDPAAGSTLDLDYRRPPLAWFDAGFTEVVFLVSPEIIYARHRR